MSNNQLLLIGDVGLGRINIDLAKLCVYAQTRHNKTAEPTVLVIYDVYGPCNLSENLRTGRPFGHHYQLLFKLRSDTVCMVNLYHAIPHTDDTVNIALATAAEWLVLKLIAVVV